MFLTKSFEKKTIHTKTMGNLEKGNGSEAVMETIAARRPLMYDEYNLCEMAHGNQLFLLQKQFAY